MGLALKADDGFVKVLADPEDGEVLGCHVLGPDAATLIHEVVRFSLSARARSRISGN